MHLQAFHDRITSVEETQKVDHDLLNEIHTVLCKNGFIASVKTNNQRIYDLEKRHHEEDAINKEGREGKDRRAKTKTSLREWISLGVAFGIPMSIYLLDKF